MRFKTNIKCNGCIQTVKPKLDGITEITSWSVDLGSPDRILTVEGEKLDEFRIIAALDSVGYKAVKVD